MGIEPIKDKDILIGKATGTASDVKSISDASLNLGAFKNNCPLWTYILAEAIQHQEEVRIPVKENVTLNTPRLGPVGGRIVAEVFLGLLFGDSNSLLSLQPNWVPEGGPNYALKDLVKYALGN
jgi:hypothetical protein